MNTQKNPILLLFILAFCLQSCVKDKCERERTYTKYTPVYASMEEIRTPIQMDASRALTDPGKIYVYNDYIFINEKREGVHIFDNTNPDSPEKIGFLSIPGNVDIAIRNNTLLADNYIDLLSIDISDINNPTLIKRTEDAFPSLGNSAQGVLLYYDEEEVTEMVDCSTSNNRSDDDLVTVDFDSSGPETSNGGGDGTGGSLARFSLYDQYLYAIDQSNMYTFDIQDLGNPNLIGETSVGWNIETLYAFGDKLFIGSQQGLFIYDAANPAAPEYISGYEHWTACDPVFVKDNYAYVTLRDGEFCNGSTLNQLDLVDITNILEPILVESFPMDNPHGLSIKDDNLFLCEGDSGLKVFDLENPLTLDERLLSKLTSLSATDVIVLPGDRNILLVVGADGFYQVDFNNPEDLQVLSFIASKG